VTAGPIDYYDERRWTDVVHDRPLDQREEIAIKLAAPLLGSRGGRLLDAGCGDGRFMSAIDAAHGLRARDWELHGVDYSTAALDHAAKLPYSFRQCNLETGVPYADAEFDLVYAGEVIEHIYNPDLLLSEAHRVLRAGGHLILTTPNLQAWYNRPLFAAGIQPVFYEVSTRSTAIGAGPLARLKRGSRPVGHLRLFNRRALLDLLASEKFTLLAMRGASFPAVPRVLQAIDRAFNGRPSLASAFVVLAVRSPG
jgi:SAM-dependent methyltransferase